MKARAANAIDRLIGHNIRIRRLSRRLSQSQLAEQLGVTSQQIQKYEKGSNRVAGSRLWQIAELFEIPIQNLFVGVEKYKISDTSSPLALIAHPDALRLLDAFARTEKPSLRRTIVNLVETVARPKK